MYIGVIWEIFYMLGSLFKYRERLNSFVRGLIIDKDIFFMIRGDILFGFEGLFIFKIWIWFNIFWLEIIRLFIWFGGLGLCNGGLGSWGFIGKDEILVKYLLNVLVLLIGWNRVWLDVLRGGSGLWLLFSLVKDLIIFYYLLGGIVLLICVVSFLL